VRVSTKTFDDRSTSDRAVTTGRTATEFVEHAPTGEAIVVGKEFPPGPAAAFFFRGNQGRVNLGV
jgi:hypothetical protein